MRKHLPKFTVAFLSFSFTVLVFLNTYEVVFNRDIAVASSVDRSALQIPLNEVITDFTIKAGVDQTNFHSEFGQLTSIEIPATKAKVQLEEARKIDNLWYGRPSFASYIGLNKDSHDTTVDYLIYAKQSWRTFPAGDQIETGMEIELFHSKGAKSLYSVTSKKLLPNRQSLIVSKSERRQIVLMIENPTTNTYYGYSLEQEN